MMRDAFLASFGLTIHEALKCRKASQGKYLKLFREEENFDTTHMNKHTPQKHHHILKEENGYTHGRNTEILMKCIRKSLGNESHIYFCIEGNRDSHVSAFIAEALKNAWYTEVSGLELENKKEIHKLMRGMCRISFQEQMRIVRGEVTSISKANLALKTRDMESTFDIGKNIRQELEAERICNGDIVKIYKDCGFVTRVGRAEIQDMELATDLVPLIPIPDGECIRSEMVCSEFTLNEIDMINEGGNAESDLYRSRCVSGYVQDAVDDHVSELIGESKAEGSRGVVVIYDANAMKRELLESVFNYQKRRFCPVVIFVNDDGSGHNVPECAANSGIEIVNISLETTDNDRKWEILRKMIGRLGMVFEKETEDYLRGVLAQRGLSYVINILQASTFKGNKIQIEPLESICANFKPLE